MAVTGKFSSYNIQGGKIIQKLMSILFLIFMILVVIPSSVLAATGDDSNSGLGWILFYITLVILIVIIVLWMITYFIMRGVIKRLESSGDKVRRFEARKDMDEEHRYKEEDRNRQRRKRTPTGNCLVCNRKFIPGADAYQCECGKFMHVHCLSDMALCPHCGREINEDYGVVRVEDSGRGGGSDRPARKKINRLLKAKFCPVCNKIIKAGDAGIQCDCGAVFHERCSDRARKCPKCGN
jgi:hypothetical protein